ncbi:hypothetical protein OXX59_006367 [Metschnikowia pulcherrima]
MLHRLPLAARAETTALKQPKELFSYSRNIDGEWQTDEKVSKQEGLNYFYFPDSYVDKQYALSGGIKTYKKIPDAENVADFASLLKSLQAHEQASGKKVKADIITFRGVMTKLLSLPYFLNNEIHLYVIAYDGQIYIKNDDERDLKKRASEQEKLSREPEKEKHMQTCEYGGYKFETLATLPKPWAETSRSVIEKRHKKVVNNYEQYISVVRTGIGKVKTLLAGEVDCVWDYVPESGDILPHYAELKTSRVVETPQQAFQFEKKLFRTWAQCFLLGITRMVYGFRDDNYILRDVEVYRTEEVPVLIKDNGIPGRNGPKVMCMNALKWYGAVLDWIVKHVDATDESKAYRIDYDSGSRTFSMSECVGDENKALRNGGILTEEFKAWRETLNSR